MTNSFWRCDEVDEELREVLAELARLKGEGWIMNEKLATAVRQYAQNAAYNDSLGKHGDIGPSSASVSRFAGSALISTLEDGVEAEIVEALDHWREYCAVFNAAYSGWWRVWLERRLAGTD